MALVVLGMIISAIVAVAWREARQQRRVNRIRALAASDPDLLLVPKRVAQIAYDRAMSDVDDDKNHYEGYPRGLRAVEDERSLQLLERILKG